MTDLTDHLPGILAAYSILLVGASSPGPAVALSAAPVRTAYATGRRWIETGLGCFFAFAAFRLATAER